MIVSLYSDFEQCYNDDIEKIRGFLQDRQNSAGKHWRVKGPYKSGKSTIVKTAIKCTCGTLANKPKLISDEPIFSKEDFLNSIERYCVSKIEALGTSRSFEQLVIWTNYHKAVEFFLGKYSVESRDHEINFFDCLLAIHNENKLVWWVGACPYNDLRELNGVYARLVQLMHARSIERDRIPTILIEHWTSESAEWDDSNVKEVPINREIPNMSQEEKAKQLTLISKPSSSARENMTELAIKPENDSFLTESVIQEIFGSEDSLSNSIKDLLREIVKDFAGMHFGANEMIFNAFEYAMRGDAARIYIQTIIATLQGNNAPQTVSIIEELLKFYETEQKATNKEFISLDTWSVNLERSIANHVKRRLYLHKLGLCIGQIDNLRYIRFLRKFYSHQGEGKMDPFISYMAVVAPVLTPLVMEAGMPVAKYFGESTVELLKRLFNRGEDPVEVARRHQQTLDDFIEAKLELSQTDSDRAYAESMRAMQSFVKRPDVFVTEQPLRDFYFALNVATPFGPYGDYNDERKETKKETAAHFVSLAWSEKKLHVAAKWLKENRLAAFQTINNE
jgi:hypothetical protein